MNFFKTHLVWIVVALCIVVLFAGTIYHFRRIIFPPPIPPPTHITFPEGVTVHEIAARVANTFPHISENDFLYQASSSEGYLFPDTYFFQTSVDAALIVKKLSENFDTKIASLSGDIRASGHSLADIITMASIIEKEARDDIDRHMISGILWNRIERDMPLQVDAARDTYTHVGLPSEPICNPGLESIEASLRPTKTNYLYYLTGTDGVMHYATTFAEHQSNQRKYLK